VRNGVRQQEGKIVKVLFSICRELDGLELGCSHAETLMWGRYHREFRPDMFELYEICANLFY
jgi:hypothetical protein